MKNTLKFMFVALVMTAMISCGGGKTEQSESTEEVMDSEATEAPAMSDTTVAADSVGM